LNSLKALGDGIAILTAAEEKNNEIRALEKEALTKWTGYMKRISQQLALPTLFWFITAFPNALQLGARGIVICDLHRCRGRTQDIPAMLALVRILSFW
jgi:hypothetical protein